MKITIVADKPNFKKIANRERILFRLVHTEQHYNKNHNNIFWEGLYIALPDADVEVKKGSQVEKITAIRIDFETLNQKLSRTYIPIFWKELELENNNYILNKIQLSNPEHDSEGIYVIFLWGISYITTQLLKTISEGITISKLKRRYTTLLQICIRKYEILLPWNSFASEKITDIFLTK